MRASLMLATSALFVAAGAAAQNTFPIGGGGADGLAGVIGAEVKLHNTGSGCTADSATCRLFGPYGNAGSDAAITGFLTDDLACDVGDCKGQGGIPGNTTDYATPDFGLSPHAITSWATATFGQALAGNLIQFPAFGAAAAIPVVNPAIARNGAATFSDADLCGLYSGLIQNGNQIVDSRTPLTPGPITIAYPSDDTGVALWLTTHLANVCTASNSNIVFTPTTNLASLFPNRPPPNFIGFSNQNAMAAYLIGCGTMPPPPSGIGLLLPNATTLPASPIEPIVCANGQTRPSTLVVAALQQAGANPILPTVSEIALGLANPHTGADLQPPRTKQAASNPANWAPAIASVAKGYPLVGYAQFVFAQCYADSAVPPTLRSFLTDHLTNKAYLLPQENDGFVPLSLTGRNGYRAAIHQVFVTNSQHWNLDIGDTAACAGLKGR